VYGLTQVTYLVVGMRGILLTSVILRQERRHDHIWISNFLWRQFRGGVMPLYGIWAGHTHIWGRRNDGKRIPRNPTTKYGSPFVAIWFITFHRPERTMTQNGRVTSILGQDTLIWHMGGAYPYMGTPQRRGFLGCIKLITPYYLWCLNFGIQVY
jgi:hypothetical protein